MDGVRKKTTGPTRPTVIGSGLGLVLGLGLGLVLVGAAGGMVVFLHTSITKTSGAAVVPLP